MKEIFEEEDKRKCRHQTYHHKPAVEKGWGRDTPIETSRWFLFICLTTTSLFLNLRYLFHDYFFRWQTERNNYFFKYHLIKTLISRIIDVFERVIFYFMDFTVNLHTKGSGEKYGCTRVPDQIIYFTLIKGQCHESFCFRFYHESSSPNPLKITSRWYQWCTWLANISVNFRKIRNGPNGTQGLRETDSRRKKNWSRKSRGTDPLSIEGNRKMWAIWMQAESGTTGTSTTTIPGISSIKNQVRS